ncbi:MAG: type II toxin-antitoxin system VapC family toxin [Planctomycetota bacterium]
MRRYLLDTHAVLWFWWDLPQLSARAKAAIMEPTNQKLVSPATPWEVAIKVSLGKIDIGGPFLGFFSQNMVRSCFEWIAVRDEHHAKVAELPFHHRDPFDRLLVAQALVEDITLISADGHFDAYGITRIWN